MELPDQVVRRQIPLRHQCCHASGPRRCDRLPVLVVLQIARSIHTLNARLTALRHHHVSRIVELQLALKQRAVWRVPNAVEKTPYLTERRQESVPSGSNFFFKTSFSILGWTNSW